MAASPEFDRQGNPSAAVRPAAVYNVQELFTDLAEVTYINRLRELETLGSIVEDDPTVEMPIALIEYELDKLSPSELNKAEVDSALRVVNMWTADKDTLGWRHGFWGRRQYLYKNYPETKPEVDPAFKTDHRIVGWKGDMLVMLADHIEASDLKLILRLEKRMQGNPIDTTNPLIESIKNASGLKGNLTDKDYRFLSLLYLSDSEIAATMGTESQDSRLSRLRSKLGLIKDIEFAAFAVREAIMDLNDIKPGKTSVFQLNWQEREALKVFRGLLQPAAEALDTSDTTISRRLKSVRSKLGVPTNRQAFLLAVKEGLIDLDTA